MPVTRPYFNLHQITTGKYTSGGEYVLNDGSDYIGAYHILPTQQLFTGPRPESQSVEIFPKRFDVTADILRYNIVTENVASRYETPVEIPPTPTANDYAIGKIERFLIQKRNSPLNTIVEIDNIQFNKINTENNPGINGVIWRRLKIEWIISKIPQSDAYYLNQQTIVYSLNDFPGLGLYLTNPLEFYR